MTLLAVQSVSKRYGAVAALDAVDLAVAHGSRTAIVGPSGSGKTTLLRMIAGFEAPDSGRVLLDGMPLADGPRAVPAHLRSIGFVPQDGALFPHLSIADNIGFGLPPRTDGRDARIAALIDMVELDRATASRRPHELSGGQQQRVALARALARQPKLMLLDEPFSALDAGLRAAMRKAVAQVLRAAGITAILVTHDQTEALSFADQVAVMRGGRLMQAGAPRDLYLHPADEGIATFLGEAIVLPATLGEGWADCALGRVATNAPRGAGPGRILLRPEQIHLSGETLCTARGTITEVEFGGAACLVTVALDDGATTLTVPGSSLDLPTPGTDVAISVHGPAHVFG